MHHSFQLLAILTLLFFPLDMCSGLALGFGKGNPLKHAEMGGKLAYWVRDLKLGGGILLGANLPILSNSHARRLSRITIGEGIEAYLSREGFEIQL